MSARRRLGSAAHRAQPGRTRLMVAAVALGVGLVGSIMGAQTAIDRELAGAFDATSPASAELTITLTGADAAAADAIGVARAVPGVVDASARAQYELRLAGADGWQPAVLIAAADLSSATVARAFPDQGAPWPPPSGTVAVERASRSEVTVAIGDSLNLTGPETSGTVTVSGFAYDPGRTPAWINGLVVAFADESTLADLGLPSAPNRLLIRTLPQDREAVRAVADSVVTALESAGIAAHVVSVPTPGEHPAAGVINTLMYLLTTFGAIAAIAAIGLLVALVSADIRRQLPVIAVAKVGGATSRDLTTVFLRGVGRIAGYGTAIAIPLGMLGTWALTAFALRLLNVDAAGSIAEPWVFGVQIALGLAVPIVATVVPVRRSSRLPARVALSPAASAPRGRLGPARSRTLPQRVRHIGWRNAVRQPGRLAVSVVALALGIAASITALNTGAAWNSAVDNEFRAQAFLAQAALAKPVPLSTLDATFAGSGVTAEPWIAAEASVTVNAASGDGVTVLVPPKGWNNPGFALLAGRWFDPSEREAVITQGLTDPHITVGDSLLIGDDPLPYAVVGRILQLTGGEAGTAYVTETPLGFPEPDSANALRLIDPTSRTSEAAAIEIVSSSGLPVATAATASDAREALDDHLLIITGLLLMLAIAIGVVGLVALVETLTTAVSERRAEFAVMRVQGAQASTITRVVRVEALSVSGLALAVATALAVPLTIGVESAVGTIFIGAPLPFVWWWPAVLTTGVAALGIALAASIVPGYEAADTPASESLAGE